MIDPVDALRFQLGAIAGREPLASFLSVLHRPMDEVLFLERLVPIGELDDASIEILKRGQACDVYVGAAPRSGPEHDVVRVWCLWVDVDDADALKGLGRFEPQPAIVIQTSTADHAQAIRALRDLREQFPGERHRPTSPPSPRHARRRRAREGSAS